MTSTDHGDKFQEKVMFFYVTYLMEKHHKFRSHSDINTISGAKQIYYITS